MVVNFRKEMSVENLKAFIYIGVLVTILIIVNMAFKNIDAFKPYEKHLPYIYAILVFVLGYKIIGSFSQAVYYGLRKITDHSTSLMMKTVTKIAGAAVLISLLSSIFGVNASSALTIGSFSGLVIGMAFQTTLTNVIAGIFIIITQPFKLGDEITVLGKTGVVKEIRIMHTVIEVSSENSEVLIPSNKIINEIIVRKTG